MKLSYKQKLFLYFFVVFSIFTIGIIFFQQKREKAYKTENLRTTLNDYATILAQYIVRSSWYGIIVSIPSRIYYKFFPIIYG